MKKQGADQHTMHVCLFFKAAPVAAAAGRAAVARVSRWARSGRTKGTGQGSKKNENKRKERTAAARRAPRGSGRGGGGWRAGRALVAVEHWLLSFV